ncbi:hypothetical protein E1301_Tti010497 [Triplophysa tibetana]|uniref:C2H2-type domain-containing protein n=1 Tax=Triplophysa tibetana TaxID=1572043 RepID=A0A5A9NCL9_9TELE|nr:hypothetical protein E1301_Tti010497 [Triplophysa tibetana]
MAKLQILNVFLTERLTLAAQEIFKVVEDIFSEYNDEICRSRQEVELLRKRLQQAGLQLDSEMHSFESTETQTLSEEQWRSEQDGKDTEMQMKLEVYTQQEENRVHLSVYNESSSSLLPSMDTCHNQMTIKDIDSQIMDSSDNDFPFTDQTAEIKNEPGFSENGRDCQVQQFTRHCLDDPGSSHASSVDKTELINIDSSAHKTHTFHLPPRTQERLTLQHRMELAQIRESKLQTHWGENQRNSSEYEEMHKVKKIRQTEEVALHKEQHLQTQPETNLADLCLENIQHEEELSDNYHTHQDMHGNAYGTGEYFCVVCHRRFSSSGLLKIHLRIHSGEKPYHCSFCGKNFRQSSHLNTHVRIHTGERPHICQNCGRTFIDSSARNRHFKKCVLIALQGQ